MQVIFIPHPTGGMTSWYMSETHGDFLLYCHCTHSFRWCKCALNQIQNVCLAAIIDTNMHNINNKKFLTLMVCLVAGLAISPDPGFPVVGKPGLGNNVFLAQVGNNTNYKNYIFY